MAHQKYIKGSKNDIRLADHNAWETMKPFVKFGAGAISVLGHTFFGIAKGAINLLHEHHEKEKSDKIIKL
ncbi:hypothetical protein KXQ82_15895 [Mucilaginibacter sp. HMF5004]|uniref:hypothetical protein n=1 Tax=Mucilaginibacter rivuli TaxID=2857527 RepID=UPI001C5F5EE6|nr:hypothetical protein [Mucilaginibacter rivuli]MBW4891209.1 hypothetical protein [Mucilaginibacter rivuli]